MLLCQGFSELLVRCGNDLVYSHMDEHLINEVWLCILQTINRLLILRNSDGSWGDPRSVEETAYAMLALNSCLRLPIDIHMRGQCVQTLQQGLEYLRNHFSEASRKLWVEKVVYATDSVSRGYRVAALGVGSALEKKAETLEPSKKLRFGAVSLGAQFNMVISLAKRMPIFRSLQDWVLHSCALESECFLRKLTTQRHTSFRRDGVSEDKYTAFIPFFWVASKYLKKANISSYVLFEMMWISILNFQVDEFMEVMLGQDIEDGGNNLQQQVKSIIRAYAPHQLHSTGSNMSKSTNGIQEGLMTPISDFVGQICGHSCVARASTYDKQHLRFTLQEFLAAHIQQSTDNHIRNRRLNMEASTENCLPDMLYHRWVQETGAAHTSGQYSFAFLICLLSGKKQDVFPTMEAKYLAADLAKRTSIMCRMDNDAGSISRD